MATPPLDPAFDGTSDLRRAPLTTRDRAILALLGFFLLVALTLEWWWLRHSPDERVALRSTSLFARLFDLYGACDRFYFEARSSLMLSLELLNVYVTQALNLWLVFAIVRRRSYRHVLQLAIGSYVSYSVVLYFLVGHVSGYEGARVRTPSALALFYGANVPWLVGHLFLVWDSARAIGQRFADQRISGKASTSGSPWAETKPPSVAS